VSSSSNDLYRAIRQQDRIHVDDGEKTLELPSYLIETYSPGKERMFTQACSRLNRRHRSGSYSKNPACVLGAPGLCTRRPTSSVLIAKKPPNPASSHVYSSRGWTMVIGSRNVDAMKSYPWSDEPSGNSGKTRTKKKKNGPRVRRMRLRSTVSAGWGDP